MFAILSACGVALLRWFVCATFMLSIAHKRHTIFDVGARTASCIALFAHDAWRQVITGGWYFLTTGTHEVAQFFAENAAGFRVKTAFLSI